MLPMEVQLDSRGELAEEPRELGDSVAQGTQAG